MHWQYLHLIILLHKLIICVKIVNYKQNVEILSNFHKMYHTIYLNYPSSRRDISSPPTRYTRHLRLIHPQRIADIFSIRASPSACPNLSFVTFRLLRSQNITATLSISAEQQKKPPILKRQLSPTSYL